MNKPTPIQCANFILSLSIVGGHDWNERYYSYNHLCSLLYLYDSKRRLSYILDLDDGLTEIIPDYHIDFDFFTNDIGFIEEASILSLINEDFKSKKYWKNMPIKFGLGGEQFKEKSSEYTYKYPEDNSEKDAIIEILDDFDMYTPKYINHHIIKNL